MPWSACSPGSPSTSRSGATAPSRSCSPARRRTATPRRTSTRASRRRAGRSSASPARGAVRGPPRPRHPAAGGARPDDHFPVQHLLRDADDQRRGPGAGALGRVRGCRQPARLRAVARGPGGDRDRRGPAAGGPDHLRDTAARCNSAQQIGREIGGRTALERAEIVRSAIERWRRATTSRPCARTRPRPAHPKPHGASRPPRAPLPSGWRGPPRTASRSRSSRRPSPAGTRHYGADAGLRDHPFHGSPAKAPVGPRPAAQRRQLSQVRTQVAPMPRENRKQNVSPKQ